MFIRNVDFFFLLMLWWQSNINYMSLVRLWHWKVPSCQEIKELDSKKGTGKIVSFTKTLCNSLEAHLFYVTTTLFHTYFTHIQRVCLPFALLISQRTSEIESVVLQDKTWQKKITSFLPSYKRHVCNFVYFSVVARKTHC